MRGAISPFPNTPSWHGGQLKAQGQPYLTLLDIGHYSFLPHPYRYAACAHLPISFYSLKFAVEIASLSNK